MRKLLLNFKKTGTIVDSNGYTVTTEQLSGAVFEVYADPDGQELIATLETRLDAANNSQSYIQSSLASEDSNNWEQLYLEPGPYYYKEIKARMAISPIPQYIKLNWMKRMKFRGFHYKQRKFRYDQSCEG